MVQCNQLTSLYFKGLTQYTQQAFSSSYAPPSMRLTFGVLS